MAVEMEKCKKCGSENIAYRVEGSGYSCSDCGYEDKPQTNADRIRSMSDEELYNFIEKVKMCGGLVRTEETSSECRGCCDGFCCNVLQWLKSEVKVGE